MTSYRKLQEPLLTTGTAAKATGTAAKATGTAAKATGTAAKATGIAQPLKEHQTRSASYSNNSYLQEQLIE
jgi:hypothetical protein